MKDHPQAQTPQLKGWLITIAALLPALAIFVLYAVRAVSAMIALPTLSDIHLPCSGKAIRHDPKPHPTARITESHIAPSESIAVGEVLHASARIDCPRIFGRPVVAYDYIGLTRYTMLYDDGTHGDTTARDGLWEVDVVWNEKSFYEGAGWAQVFLGLRDDYDYIPGVLVELKEKPLTEKPAP